MEERQKTKRQERIDAITKRLEEGVREIFENGKFGEYLRIDRLEVANLLRMVYNNNG